MDLEASWGANTTVFRSGDIADLINKKDRVKLLEKCINKMEKEDNPLAQERRVRLGQVSHFIKKLED